MLKNRTQVLKCFFFAILSLPILIFLDFGSTIVPRNGGCEPRIICEEVPVDRVKSNNVASFPQCVEVHRCGGCCQEGQFQCLPVKKESVTFSPVSKQNYIASLSYEVYFSYY